MTSKQSSVVIGSIDGVDLTLDELMFQIKQPGQTALQQLFSTKIIRKTASKNNITVSVNELQQAADDYRRAAGLHSSEMTQKWLESVQLTLDDFEKMIEDQLLQKKVMDIIASDEAIQKEYVDNRLKLEFVKIAHLVLADQNLANELKAQLDDGEELFCELVQHHSIDLTTKDQCGFIGIIYRGMIPAKIENELFSDKAGEYVGPIEYNGKFYIYKLLCPKKSELDDTTKSICKQRIYQEWLKQRISETKIQLTV
ncbi:MAG: peptidylprolyl isomerase [Desulfobacterales bacterium]|nr:peptidylprolyl isomerase [Desulfobacterales bacterium]